MTTSGFGQWFSLLVISGPFSVVPAQARQPLTLFQVPLVILASGLLCSVSTGGSKNFLVLLISVLLPCPFSFSVLHHLGNPLSVVNFLFSIFNYLCLFQLFSCPPHLSPYSPLTKWIDLLPHLQLSHVLISSTTFPLAQRMSHLAMLQAL